MTVIEGDGSVARSGAGAGGMVPMPAGSRDVPIRELLSDEVLDLLAERSRDEAGSCV
ncbi:hypothetical protein SAMN04489713_102270 [Actinomadura madurae]|uniref:Uncharacterized protein n=1 Tax=Actinomadura madurae TaxID=1993 RepID=A0A1I4ZN92_9ACTN|nr:hypothetical protein SAMN04489713_102270 [Actinomadura madurae]